MRILIKLVVTALAVWVATVLVSGIHLHAHTTAGKITTLIVVALIFGIINAVLKPIAKTIGCLAYAVTFGLISIVVNGLLFWLTSWVAAWRLIGTTTTTTKPGQPQRDPEQHKPDDRHCQRSGDRTWQVVLSYIGDDVEGAERPDADQQDPAHQDASGQESGHRRNPKCLTRRLIHGDDGSGQKPGAGQQNACGARDEVTTVDRYSPYSAEDPESQTGAEHSNVRIDAVKPRLDHGDYPDERSQMLQRRLGPQPQRYGAG